MKFLLSVRKSSDHSKWSDDFGWSDGVTTETLKTLKILPAIVVQAAGYGLSPRTKFLTCSLLLSHLISHVSLKILGACLISLASGWGIEGWLLCSMAFTVFRTNSAP